MHRMTEAPAYSCPIDRRCGGCTELRVPYARQLARKREAVACLFAEFDGLEVAPVLGMDVPLHYRNKVVSPFVGVYDRKERRRRILCGMYERGTHRVIDSSECLIENQVAKAIIQSVRQLMSRTTKMPMRASCAMPRFASAMRRARSWSRL